MIIYRNMTANDTQKVFELWKELFPQDPISFGHFNYLLFGNDELDFSFYWLACEEENIVGTACGAMDHKTNTAYIQFIGVKKESRRLGIASSLMENLLKEFSGRGAKEVFFSGYPRNYAVPGLDGEKYPEGLSFFTKLGFSPSTNPASMELLLDTYQPPQMNLHEDFTILPFKDEHLAPIFSLCKEHLQPEWVETIMTGYLKGNYSCNGFVCLDKKANMVGFSFYGMVGDDRRRFGPIGINPNYRGFSLGKILLHACLKDQKETGCDKSYFLWGDEGSVAKQMYERSGFTVYSQMSILQKSIGNNQ